MLFRYTLLIGLFFATVGAYAQYEPMSSLSMYNHMYYNPGYAGDGNEIEARLLNRNQWMGFEGQPNTMVVNIDAPFNLFGYRHGAGISIIRDALGFQQNIGINLSYAYRKKMMQGELGFGIGLNIVDYSLNPTWITGNADPNTDPLIPDGSDIKAMSFDANVGVFYRSDNMYFSASVRNLAGTGIDWKTESATNPSSVARHVYLSTGYDYQLANPLFALQPNVFVSTDFSVTQVNLIGKLTYNNRFSGGLGFRPGGALWAIAGIDLPSGLEVAVSYDIETSRMMKSSSGSFDFMVGYSFDLGIDKDVRKYKSVRLL